MVAICLAVRMKVLYSEYDRGNWQLHFDTMEACEARINEEVHVHILTPYAIMARLLHEALAVLLESNPYAGMLGLTASNFSASTIDSAQGSTWDFTVLAIPEDLKDWSNFLCDARRLVTLLSRAYLSIALPKLSLECAQMHKSRLSREGHQLLVAFSADPDSYFDYSYMQAYLHM